MIGGHRGLELYCGGKGIKEGTGSSGSDISKVYFRYAAKSEGYANSSSGMLR